MDKKALQYSLKGIKKLTSYVNSLDSLSIKNFAEEKVVVKKGFQFAFDKVAGNLTIRVLIDFLCREDTPSSLKLFGAIVQYDFIFKDFKEIVKEIDEHKVDIPDDLLITLMSVSYSTTRGILAMLSSGTDYQQVFLPIINIQEFKTMLQKTTPPKDSSI